MLKKMFHLRNDSEFSSFLYAPIPGFFFLVFFFYFFLFTFSFRIFFPVTAIKKMFYLKYVYMYIYSSI